MQICRVCGLPGEYYSSNKVTCKACVLERIHANKENLRLTRRLTYQKRKAKIKSYYHEWYIKNGRKRNKEQVAAHTLVAMALRKGIIVRPSHCAECERKLRIEAHHEDYLKPLEVIWLCNRCHRKRHIGM